MGDKTYIHIVNGVLFFARTIGGWFVNIMTILYSNSIWGTSRGYLDDRHKFEGPISYSPSWLR